MTKDQIRNIKRKVFELHGIIGLSDEEIDSAYLFGDEKEGVVVRFKINRPLNLKDWRCTQVTVIS